MTASSTGVKAVVWRATQIPPDLVAALARQGIRWEEACGPYDALSRLLACRRESPRSRVLLLVEPEALPQTDDVRAALVRFDPETGCWAYRATASPRLAPLAALAASTVSAGPEVVVRPSPTPRSTPELRLAGDGGLSEPVLGTGGLERDEEPRTPRSLLTPEELAMLLADDR